MIISLPRPDIEIYIDNLLRVHFPFPTPLPPIPKEAHTHALERLEYCFSHIHRKYYQADGQTVFDLLNADHLCSYLWFLANTLGSTHHSDLAVALSHLNKRLHAVDLFYSVKMPDIFLLVHPVGSVFGAASYSNYFVGYQNCTIGSDGSSYPVLGEGVICYSRTTILGSCTVGSNVVFAANTFILNTDVADDSLVTGSFPSNRFLPNTKPTLSRVFTTSN